MNTQNLKSMRIARLSEGLADNLPIKDYPKAKSKYAMRSPERTARVMQILEAIFCELGVRSNCSDRSLVFNCPHPLGFTISLPEGVEVFDDSGDESVGDTAIFIADVSNSIHYCFPLMVCFVDPQRIYVEVYEGNPEALNLKFSRSGSAVFLLPGADLEEVEV